MILVALEEAAQKGELLLVEGGMCRFHRLRDGSITIREILVLPGMQRQGIGSGMVRQVLAMAKQNTVRARCPAQYPANAFWLAMGFTLIGETTSINLWQYSPNPGLFGVPTK